MILLSLGYLLDHTFPTEFHLFLQSYTLCFLGVIGIKDWWCLTSYIQDVCRHNSFVWTGDQNGVSTNIECTPLMSITWSIKLHTDMQRVNSYRTTNLTLVLSLILKLHHIHTRTLLNGFIFDIPLKVIKNTFNYTLNPLTYKYLCCVYVYLFSFLDWFYFTLLFSSPLTKYLLEISDLLDIQRKMDLYRSMFYCNTESDRDSNFIKAESLRIELIAGGLNWKQQDFIMDRLQPNSFLEVRTVSKINKNCYR